MTEQPRIKCAIPQSWQAELEILAEQAGQSVEQIVYEAIAQYLGKMRLDKPEISANALMQMQSQLQRLESQLAKADMALMQTTSLTTRVIAIEQAIGRSTQTHDSPPQADLDEDDGIEDDGIEDDGIEDEPDEILISFLESDDFQGRIQEAINPGMPRKPVLSLADESCENEEYEDGEVLYDFIEP